MAFVCDSSAYLIRVYFEKWREAAQARRKWIKQLTQRPDVSWKAGAPPVEEVAKDARTATERMVMTNVAILLQTTKTKKDEEEFLQYRQFQAEERRKSAAVPALGGQRLMFEGR